MVSPAKPKKKTAPSKEFGTSGSMSKDVSILISISIGKCLSKAN